MSEVEQAIGHLVQVESTIGTMFGGARPEIGILRDADEEFLYLERPGGESVCIPAYAVRELRVLERPTDDAATIRTGSVVPSERVGAGMIGRFLRRLASSSASADSSPAPGGVLDLSEAGEAIGQWVQVAIGGESLYTGGRQFEFGILRDADEAFLYIERPSGETVCLPAGAAREMRIVEAPAGITFQRQRARRSDGRGPR